MNKIVISCKTIVLGIILAGLSSCEPLKHDPLPPDPNTKPWTATHTIGQLLDSFATEKGDFFPVRPNSGTANLFSVDRIPSEGDDIIINGRVVSTDQYGNMYKYIIIQDLADPDMGMKISIDANSLYGSMPVGQSISLKCNGLVIGKYADMYQMGILYLNEDSDARKRGYEPGRMPLTSFTTRYKSNGMPDPDAVIADTMTISDIKSSGREVHSRLVVIKDAQFTGYGKNPFDREELTSSTYFWAYPKPSITGVPIAREITDPSGETIYITTSEFASFARTSLPEKGKLGDVTVVVSYYKDRHDREGDFQLYVRSPSDFKLK